MNTFVSRKYGNSNKNLLNLYNLKDYINFYTYYQLNPLNCYLNETQIFYIKENKFLKNRMSLNNDRLEVTFKSKFDLPLNHDN